MAAPLKERQFTDAETGNECMLAAVEVVTGNQERAGGVIYKANTHGCKYVDY